MDHLEILPISKAPVRKGEADLRPALWRRPRGVDGRSPAGMARPGSTCGVAAFSTRRSTLHLPRLRAGNYDLAPGAVRCHQ